MATRKGRAVEEEEEVLVDESMLTGEVVNLISTPTFLDFVVKVMMAEVEIDTEALTAEFEDDLVRHRKGDYGKMLDYVPAKYIRDRLNDVLGCKWSFFPLMEQRVVDPIPTYSKSDDEMKSSPKYIKVVGVLAIPGLGVQVQYGVKKTLGFNESNDWKAAATDAFKKCCSAFGIEADYEIDDDVSDDDVSPVDMDEVEYDDDTLAEALETEVTFGKYKEFSMEEVLDEDPDYLKWLAENARDKDVRGSALIVLKYNDDKKKSKSKGTKKAAPAKKTSSTSKTTSKKTSSSTTKKTSATRKPVETDDDDEREELIEQITEIFDDSEEYDTVTMKELIKSISVSKKTPNGKRKLEDLTLKELQNLANVLTDEDDEEDEEDE